MADENPDFVTTNQIEFRIIPPNRGIFTVRGIVDEPDAAAYTKHLFAYADKANVLLDVLIDISEFDRLTDKAKTHFIRIRRKYPYRRIAFVGASLSARMLCTMILRAGRLVSPDKWLFEFEFFATTEQAEKWLNTRN